MREVSIDRPTPGGGRSAIDITLAAAWYICTKVVCLEASNCGGTHREFK